MRLRGCAPGAGVDAEDLSGGLGDAEDEGAAAGALGHGVAKDRVRVCQRGDALRRAGGGTEGGDGPRVGVELAGLGRAGSIGEAQLRRVAENGAIPIGVDVLDPRPDVDGDEIIGRVGVGRVDDVAQGEGQRLTARGRRSAIAGGDAGVANADRGVEEGQARRQ